MKRRCKAILIPLSIALVLSTICNVVYWCGERLPMFDSGHMTGVELPSRTWFAYELTQRIVDISEVLGYVMFGDTPTRPQLSPLIVQGGIHGVAIAILTLLIWGYVTRARLDGRRPTRCGKCNHVLRNLVKPECPSCHQRI